MGMFDELRCEVPIPVGQSRVFQTKDIQEWCQLEEYVLSQDGRLLKVGDGCGNKIEPPEDLGFDGDVCFYDFEEPQKAEGWLEYRATFRGGQCVEICRLCKDQWLSVWKKCEAA